MKTKIISWIRQKLSDFLFLDITIKEVATQQNQLKELVKVIKERTDYHLDVHQYTKHNSQVILIGKFRNNDFVKCYNIPDTTFVALIDHCRELEKYSHRGKVDAWPGFSATVKHSI